MYVAMTCIYSTQSMVSIFYLHSPDGCVAHTLCRVFDHKNAPPCLDSNKFC